MAKLRRSSAPNRAILAAARRLDLGTKSAPRKVHDWQKEAWRCYDEVPEVKELILWRGNQLAKIRWYVAAFPPGDTESTSDPVPVDDPESGVPPALADAAKVELARLSDPLGGQAQIARCLDENLEVVGEAHLVGLAPRPAVDNLEAREEQWFVASIDEVTTKNGIGPDGLDRTFYTVQRGDDKQMAVVLDEDAGDEIIRVWQPHPRKWDYPDCAMRGILATCELYLQLGGQLLAGARARMNAGLLIIPNNLSFSSASPSDQTVDDETADQFMIDLTSYLTGTATAPDDQGTVVPAVLRGNAEDLTPEVLRHLTFERPSDTHIDERIEKAVMRIARGLSAPVEVVTGLMATTFANARQVDEAKYAEYLEPRASALSDAITSAYLRPRLLALGFAKDAVDRVFVWQDPSDLVGRPSQEDHASEAHDKLLISDAAARRALGYSEADAPDAQEILDRTGVRRGILTSSVTVALLQALADEAGVALPDASQLADEAGPVAQTAALVRLVGSLGEKRRNGHHPQAILAASRGVSDLGRKLAAIDQDLNARLLVAANDHMERALDRAGSRVRTKLRNDPAVRASARGWQVVADAGEARVAAAGLDTGDLLDGAWDALEAQFMRWGAGAQEKALRLTYRLVGGFTAAERDRLGLRMAADLGEAWAWMRGTLDSLAGATLFDLSPSAPSIGEFDASLRVPPSLVRQAVARAGGAAGLETAGSGEAFVTLVNAGTRPAGGIGTGTTVMEALADHGAVTEAYLWDYGQALRQRPFPPHLALDGVQFSNFDDPVLTNSTGWPSGISFPGDHSGCVAAGTLVSGEVASALTLRWYEGTMVELTTASGEFLAITPNHPVLTDRGWVAAGLLREGDHVVRCFDAHAAAGLVPHEGQVPTRVEDLFAARWVAPGVVACAVPVAAENFDGDGRGSEVAVVLADGDLMLDGQSPFVEPSCEVEFPGGDADPLLLASACRPFEGLNRVGPSSLAVMGEASESHALLRGASATQDELRLARAAWRDPSVDESAGDYGPRHAESLGESLDGLAGFVQTDKLVHVDRVPEFAGHVFNLHTGLNWYAASNLIVHNCQCNYVPIIVTPEGPQRVVEEFVPDDEAVSP